MKLRKTIEEFKVEAITTDCVTLSGKDGYHYSLKLGDKIAAVYQMDIHGHEPELSTFAERFLALGFEVKPELML